MQFILVFYFKILMLPFSFFRPICTIIRKNFNIFSSYSKIRKKRTQWFCSIFFFWPLSTFYYFPEVWSWGTWVPEYCQQPFVAPNGCSRGHGEGTRHYKRGTEGSPEEKILYNSLLFSSSHVLLIKCVVYKYPWNIVEYWYNLVMNHWIIIFVTFNFCI